MKTNRRNDVDNYVVKDVYKEIIIRRMRARKSTARLRKRLEKIHGKKWEKIIMDAYWDI